MKSPGIRITRKRRLVAPLLALAALVVVATWGTAAGSAKQGAVQPGDGKVRVLTWETYHEDPWIKQAEKDLGLDIEITRAGSVDELYAKASSGSGYDLFLVDSGSISRYRAAGLIGAVDASQLPNIKNVNTGLPFNKHNKIGGKLWAVPYNWGVQPLLYDKTKVTAAEASTWKSLWDPKFKGKVMIPDDAYITLPMVALAGGWNPFKWGDAEFSKAKTSLTALRKQVKTLTTSFNAQEQMMSSKSAVIGYGQAYQFVEKYPFLRMSFPKEGTPFWMDNYFFSKKAATDADVYKFVNYTLTPKWQCRFANQTFQNGILPATTAKAKSCFSAKVYAGAGGNLVSKLTPKVMKTLVLFLAVENFDKRLQLWNSFKSGT